jgi:hypothetical protein
MPTLLQTLSKHDLGFTRIAAQLWGLELDSAETIPAAEELAHAILDPALVNEITGSLAPEARAALEALSTAENGRLAWAAFVRRFGDVREMGAGRRDRELPHLKPASAAEVLWYRALMAKAFFETPNGLQEFAYIPDDLLEVFHHREREEEKQNPAHLAISADTSVPDTHPLNINEEPLGRPASPREKESPVSANDHILDDACTLLAALRLGIDPPALSVSVLVLSELLQALGLVVEKSRKKESAIKSEAVKVFLEAPRPEALAALARAWQTSAAFNELRHIPDLICEGEWKNDPLATRRFLLDVFALIPKNQWWSLPALIRDIKAKHPDFQRPAGDYDSWFIKRETDGVYLRGFANWENVEGVLIRTFVTLMHWFGLADLASSDDAGGRITAFRLSPFVEKKDEKGRIAVSSNGRITVDRLTPRAARYQIARFTEWEDSANPDEYRYHVTPASLMRAKEQGLKPDQLLKILQKHASAPIPPAFQRALARWELNGTEAKIENATILKVTRPETLIELRKSKAARFLEEPLGPTTIIVKSGAISKALAALAEMGLLADDLASGLSKPSEE